MVNGNNKNFGTWKASVGERKEDPKWTNYLRKGCPLVNSWLSFFFKSIYRDWLVHLQWPTLMLRYLFARTRTPLNGHLGHSAPINLILQVSPVNTFGKLSKFICNARVKEELKYHSMSSDDSPGGDKETVNILSVCFQFKWKARVVRVSEHEVPILSLNKRAQQSWNDNTCRCILFYCFFPLTLHFATINMRI